MKTEKRKPSVVPYKKRIEKPWGWELIYTKDNDPFTGKIIHINAGKRWSLQKHDEKEEAFCLMKGEAVITISDENEKVHEIPMELFEGYFISVGQIHRITAVTDIDIVETSTSEKGNTFRLEDDYDRGTETEEMRKTKNRGWKSD